MPITEDEQRFMLYWEKERQNKKRFFVKSFIKSVPLGLGLGVMVVFMLKSNWYPRATMDANSESNPFVIVLGIVVVIFFLSWISQLFRWERSEDKYKQIKTKQVS